MAIKHLQTFEEPLTLLNVTRNHPDMNAWMAVWDLPSKTPLRLGSYSRRRVLPTWDRGKVRSPGKASVSPHLDDT